MTFAFIGANAGAIGAVTGALGTAANVGLQASRANQSTTSYGGGSYTPPNMNQPFNQDAIPPPPAPVGPARQTPMVPPPPPAQPAPVWTPPQQAQAPPGGDIAGMLQSLMGSGNRQPTMAPMIQPTIPQVGSAYTPPPAGTTQVYDPTAGGRFGTWPRNLDPAAQGSPFMIGGPGGYR